MANKYNNHPQTAQEDMSEQRLIAIRQIQKQQHQHTHTHSHPQEKQHFNPGHGYTHPKMYYNNTNFQKLVMKSTLNPNAKEFYPSYLEHPKNGYTYAFNNVMNPTAPDFEHGFWTKYEYDNRYLASGRYIQGSVQRSNTVLPLVRDNYSGSGSTAVDSQSTSFQESTSVENTCKLMNIDLENENPIFTASETLKSGENVWFIDKRMETSKENSKELWTSTEETKESVSKEEYYDPQMSWSDNISKQDDSFIENEKAQQNIEHCEDSNAARKKLIMLYPVKRQEEHFIESSQESIFEEPNPINYTSDESFLVQSNCDSNCYIDNVNQIIKEGKKFYSTKTKVPSTNDILDEVQDLSDECERTAKQTDSKSYEIVDQDTSNCAMQQNQASSPLKCTMGSKKVEVKIIRKHELEKPRKLNKSDFSEKDSKAHEGPPNAREPRLTNLIKPKKLTIVNGTSKEDPKTLSKLTHGGYTGSKLTTISAAVKGSETTAKAIGKTSITGAIPKTKEMINKPTRKLNLINEESVPRSIRPIPPPKVNTAKKEEKDTEVRAQRLPNGYVSARMRNNNVEVKSIGKAEHSIKKPAPAPRTLSRSKSIERKVTTGKSSEGCPVLTKNMTTSPSTQTINNSTKKNITASTTKDRVIHKSVIKTQMRSTTNMCSESPTKKIIVINNAPKRDNESKKTKTITVSRTIQNKTNKAAVSTKIPIRQKSTSLKGVKGIIGSDGDSIKVKTSKSCISLWSAGKKTLGNESSASLFQIGDKLSENKKNISSREIANSSTRHSPMKKQSLALQ